MLELHRERLAMAVMARQNKIDFSTNLINTVANVDNKEARQRIVELFEDVYVLGHVDKKKAKGKAEDELLETLSKYTMSVSGGRAGYAARWREKPGSTPGES